MEDGGWRRIHFSILRLPSSISIFLVDPSSQSFTEIAELAGGFIHEIKNHLSTLGLNLQLLAEDFQEPQSQRERRAQERIHRLQSQCHHLVDIANDFLRFARLKDLELTPTDLAGLIEELIDFFGPTARQANIEIKCYLPADLPAVRLDRELFKQALLNLLLNAQQAMPGGGELTIQAELGSGRWAVGSGQSVVSSGNADNNKALSSLPTAHCPLPTVELSFIDTGKGMDPEVAAKAFRPFYSTKSGGSGLGLPTTRRIIEAHGGTIELQSEPGRGSKFTIRLPVGLRE